MLEHGCYNFENRRQKLEKVWIRRWEKTDANTLFKACAKTGA